MAIKINRSFEAPISVEEADRRLEVIMKWLGYRQISWAPLRQFERGNSGNSWFAISRLAFHAKLSVSISHNDAASFIELALVVQTTGQLLLPSDRLFYEGELDDAVRWVNALEQPTIDRVAQSLAICQRIYAIIAAMLFAMAAWVAAIQARFQIELDNPIVVIGMAGAGVAVALVLAQFSRSLPGPALSRSGPTMGPPIIQTLDPEGRIEGEGNLTLTP